MSLSYASALELRPGVPLGIDAAREHVLIVDDSPTVRLAFERQLSGRYNCSQASSFMDALDRLYEREFAVVVLDIQMPGISGVELLRKIVEKYPDTAVIMVSGVSRPQVVLDTMREGAFDYLIKPCDPYLLDLTVDRAVERLALVRRTERYKTDLEERNTELADGKAQLERLQAQIIQNAKMASLGRLAAGVAHELNNPVGFVLGNLEMLGDDMGKLLRLMRFYDAAELPDTIATAAAGIKSEIRYETMLDELDSVVTDCRDGAERIRDIVQNLRTFSRLGEAEFKVINIHEGIDSTVRLLSRYFTGDNIALVREYGEIPLIEGYSGQLNQVWMNLLANAAQAMDTNRGEIKIATQVQDEMVEVSISDTGPGIAAEHLEHIFDPFFTTKPVGDGTGLGLSISFSIVERHSGRIEVETEVGKGTTFKVVLPVKGRDPMDGDTELVTLQQNRI
ncbi:MAG: hybrid sensor histidine kinase/response regulator [Blastocatellia bacterium]|nr:hybrid sensor histidine kinase/response regulator [Blastocatellia bacterium]